MIVTVEELRTHIVTNESDDILTAKLKAVEIAVRNETNNNFQIRNIREVASVKNGKLILYNALFKVGDTIQISKSLYNDDIYSIASISGNIATLDVELMDEEQLTVTKVKYPQDVKMGAINMMKWDLQNRSKVGIQSETISRHSVTFYNMDSSNSRLGYPRSVVSFIDKYRKARF